MSAVQFRIGSGFGGGAAAKIKFPTISTPKDPDPFYVFAIAALLFALAVVVADFCSNARGGELLELFRCSDRLFHAFDYAACFFCGLEAGRGVAAHYVGRRRNIVFVSLMCIVIGHLVSNGGGGHARDLVFRQTLPFYANAPEYLIVAGLGGILGLLVHAKGGAITTAVLDVLDRAALGVFVVIGTNKALADAAGVSSFGDLDGEAILWAAQLPSALGLAALYAFCSGVMGGLQRDLLFYRDRTPFAFVSTLWIAAALGAILHIVTLRGVARIGVPGMAEWAWVSTIAAVTAFAYVTRNVSFAARRPRISMEPAYPAFT